MDRSSVVLLIAVVYLGLKLLLGVLTKRFADRGHVEFAVGGRSISWPYLGLGLASTNIAGGAIVGMAGLAYFVGFSAAWYFIAIAVGTVIYALFISGRFRTSRAITAPQWFREHYDAKNEILIVILNLMAAIVYLVLQTTAATLAASVILGIPHWAALLAVGGVFIAYTFLGGFVSVLTTDIFSFLIMMAGLVATVVYAANTFHWSSVQALPGQYHGIATIGVVAIVGYFLNACSWGVDQNTVARSAAAKDARHARNAGLWAALWMAIPLLFVPLIGVFGRVAYPHLTGQAANNIYPKLIGEVLPAWLAGLALAAILGATMSAGAGNLLSISNIWANDVAPRLRARASGHALVASGRAAVVVAGLIAIVLTYLWGGLPPSLINIFLLAASLTAAYFVPMLIGFYTGRLSSNVVFASMVVGGLVAISYTALSWTTGLTVWAGAIVPTFVASAVVLAVGYGITKAFVRFPGTGYHVSEQDEAASRSAR